MGIVGTDATGTFNGAIVSFAPNNNDTASQNYKASIDWGDGHGSIGTVAKNSAGSYSVLGSNTYTAAANTAIGVKVTITDANGNTAMIFNTVNVKPTQATTPVVPTTGILRPTTAGYVSTDANGLFNGVIATFVSNAADPASQTYTATITWGDGQTSAGTVTRNPGGDFSVSGTNTYGTQADRPKGATIVIKDSLGGSTTIFNTVNVKPSAPTPPLVPTVQTTTATGSTTALGTPLTAGSVKEAIMSVLRAGGTNAQALAAATDTTAALAASRAAATKPSAAAGTPVATPINTVKAPVTAMTRREAIIAARQAARAARALAHPRGPLMRM